jgi:NADPH-dependent 7-cyano-7-deazaguanine reductase QueF
MTAPQVVPCDGTTRVTITGALVHLCPHVDETDDGAVTIAWTTAGATLELHSLAAHLATYAGQRISHENLTAILTDALTLPGIADVTVTARFATAGLEVEVFGAAA